MNRVVRNKGSKNYGRRWEEAEDKILHDNPGKTGRLLESVFTEKGFDRSAGGIDCRRRFLGLALSAEEVAGRSARRGLTVEWGWPAMHGTPEARDEKFVRLVLAAGGLPRVEVGKGWIYPERRAA